MLRLVAREHGFRIAPDVEHWPILPGKYGRVEWHDATTLAAYTDRARKIIPLLAVPGVRPHQIGSTEARVLFAPERLPEVARVLRLRRRRRGRLENFSLTPR